ncbi:hypothetical protein HMPREF3293_01277 [Christensenella minuta]|jgi:hypothetical protein|uniref:Uncharacterized protein n=2 Tax=Christensenella minuta TaxID=626937 RepID=A0A136Q5B5_9FIRM|nr:hypothetical protein HMPREF3293_01277 [Christensenella minuta]
MAKSSNLIKGGCVMERSLYDRAWLLYQMAKIQIDEVQKAWSFRQPLPAAGHEEAVDFLREVADVLYRMLID